MSMFTAGLNKISAEIASRKLEKMEEKDRLEKEKMTEEELAEVERREKEAHDEVWARIEGGRALHNAIVNGEDIDEFFEEYEHGPITMSDEVVLYYLFMMSDGKVSCYEEKLFNQVCKELNIDTAGKEKAIERCKEISKEEKDICGYVTSDEFYKKKLYYLNNDKVRERVLWNLINLGYADEYYSEEEKMIVEYLVFKFEVPPEIYQEMIDVADTMLALDKQKEWTISTLPESKKREQKIEKLEKEIDNLLLDIEITIDEIYM